MYPPSTERHEDDLSPWTLGFLMLLFLVAFLSLVFLTDYSLGKEFSEAPPQMSAHQEATVADISSR